MLLTRVRVSSISFRLAITLACLLFFSFAATAQEGRRVIPIQYSGTLKKIKDSGLIRLGYRQSSPPFAFADSSTRNRPVGYSLDLCDPIVEEISEELEKEIRVEYRPVTPENRLDMVASGEIDIECGSTVNNFERRKRVAFSPTIFVTGITLCCRHRRHGKHKGGRQNRRSGAVVFRNRQHHFADHPPNDRQCRRAGNRDERWPTLNLGVDQSDPRRDPSHHAVATRQVLYVRNP